MGTFINIDPREYQLHLVEAFRNTTSFGSDLHRRVLLKVRETDSPYLLKKQTQRPQQTALAESKATTLDPKSLAFPSTSGSEFGKVSDWKASKQDQLTHKLQCLSDSKLAIETHIQELELEW